MTVGETGEAALLALLLPYLETSGFPISAGEDDAASWAAGTGFLVASTDTSVEGVHFDLGWVPPEAVGWRALALALGDLAAKGAQPGVGLVSVALPSQWPIETAVGIYRGLSRLARQVGLALLGGDTSATSGPAVITLTVIGSTDQPSLPRSAAQPGWAIGVSGPLGGALLALRERRVVQPLPRLEEGRRLNRLGICCGDISDGLYREMEKFAAVSGAGARLLRDRLPLAPGADWRTALASGEEVELVCVGPAGVLEEAGLVLVGELVEETTITVVDDDGHEISIADRGYQHFA